MKKLLTLLSIMALSVLASDSFARQHRRGKIPPAMMKKALHEAGLTDQQIRRIEQLQSDSERKLLDIQHELEKSRLDMRQLIQQHTPDEGAVMQLVDKIGAIKVRLKKNRIQLRLDVRKEMTPEQFDKLQTLRTERKMKRRQMRKHRRGKRMRGQGAWQGEAS